MVMWRISATGTQKQKMTMKLITGTLCVTILISLLPLAASHARLWEPPGRSTMWRRDFQTPVNYQDNELFCGGFSHQVSLGYKCGVCGDPYDGRRDNEAGGKYATGIITRTYRQGQEVTFQVDVTANHKGFFEFKICPTNNPKIQETQDCFDRYPVLVSNSSSSRYYVGPEIALTSVDLILPQDLTCEFCVVQFRYHAGNSWGTDPDGQSCVGCGYQEEFYGCADIRILPHGASHSVNQEGSLDTATRSNVGTSDSVIAGSVAGSSGKPSDGETGNHIHASNIVETRTTSADRSINGYGTSAYTQPPGNPNINGDNIVCLGVREGENHDLWCQLNCQLGFCPETHCKCVARQYPHGTERGSGYRAAGAFANIYGYDKWCQDNCRGGNCPSSMCVC